jgi:hypothetical protein
MINRYRLTADCDLHGHCSEDFPTRKKALAALVRLAGKRMQECPENQVRYTIYNTDKQRKG